MQSIKILIDNIFCNIPNPLLQSAISANITFSISDYLPRFFILSDYFTNSSPTKSNIIFHDSQYFNNQLFFADVETINWNQVLQLNLSLTLDNYPSTVDALIDSHAPLKNVPLKNVAKNKISFNKNHGLQEVSKIQFLRKIES